MKGGELSRILCCLCKEVKMLRAKNNSVNINMVAATWPLTQSTGPVKNSL